MKDKALEQNLKVMKNVLKLAPSLLEISSKLIEEIENNDSIVEELVIQATFYKEQVEFLVLENERLEEENRNLKTVH
jgi:hypothetical protein